MVIGIIIAFFVSVLVYALTTLVLRKLAVTAEFVWIVWLVAIVIIVFVWWNRVLAPLVGPLP